MEKIHYKYMINSHNLLSPLPHGLRDPLLKEYDNISRNFMERRWAPSELSGGKFCEIVYTILDGYASGAFPSKPHKPRDFVTACKSLESRITSPRSFQILIPRFLPALYEIRNNRGVGHTGGDVDSNHMDATAVLSMSSWVLAELIRVFHNVSITDAQSAVDIIVERRLPLVWVDGDMRRVLNPGLRLKDQIILLIGSCSDNTEFNQLIKWSDYHNKSHFTKILRELHKARLLEFDEVNKKIKLLPPGADRVEMLVRKLK